MLDISSKKRGGGGGGGIMTATTICSNFAGMRDSPPGGVTI